MRRATRFRDEKPAGIRKGEISPAHEAMEPEAPPVKEDRLRMLEVSGLPITTPETLGEVIKPALPIPRGIAEGALATGLGMVNFATGAAGWRALYEMVIEGESPEDALEKGFGQLSYDPQEAVGQKIAEYAGKPFELWRKGVTWLTPKLFEEPLRLIARTMDVTNEQADEIVRQVKLLPAAETVVGTMMEAGPFVLPMFLKLVKMRAARRADGKPTSGDIADAARETIKLRKKDQVPTERPVSPEVKALSADILAEMERRAPKITRPAEPIVEYKKGKKPVEPTVEDRDISPVRKTEEGLPVAPEEPVVVGKLAPKPILVKSVAKVKEGELVKVSDQTLKYDGPWEAEPGRPTAHQFTPQEGPLEGVTFTVGKLNAKEVASRLVEKAKEFKEEVPKPEPIPKLIDKRVQRNIIEADDYGIPPDEIAGRLGLRETQVTDVLETAAAKRTLITMEDVGNEFKYILERATKIPEEARLDFLHESTKYLTTKYTRNLDAGFVDKIELSRYLEWGDQIMGKITNARRKAGLVPEPPTVTTDFMGFQRMYEDFVGLIKKRGTVRDQPLSTRGSEMLARGMIVKQRKVRGREYPPVYEGEYQLIKGANILDERWFRRAFENPIRVFEEAGGEALLDLTIHPYHAAENAYAIAWKASKRHINELRGQVSRGERHRIMNYAVSKQKKGPALLKYMKIKKVAELTPKEMAIYEQLRTRYESLYKRLNRVRKSIGKEPLPYTEDYFTFIRDLTLMERMGFRPLDMPLDVLEAQFIKLRATPFKYAKARTRAIYKLEMDPFYVLDRYTQSALRHMHMSPLIAKLHELELGIKDPVTGNLWKMRNENPILFRAWRGWLNQIAGKKPGYSLGPFDSAMQRISSNLTASILGANIRSAMIQVSAWRNTVAEIGYGRTMEGIYDLAYGSERSLAMRKSRVLRSRKMEVSVADAIRSLRIGRWSEAKAKVGRMALKPLQVTDYYTAESTWLGAYKHAIKDLGMQKNSRRAYNYADDIVTRTQASALPGDIAPVQRSIAGRFLTLFQTFTINDWNFLLRDVLGKRNVTYKTPGAFAKAMRYITATTLFNIMMEDILKINSPFPTPIRSFMESLERGDDIVSLAGNVSKEFIEPIPLIGSARYGLGPGGPGYELAQETIKYVRKDSMRKPGLELLGKWIGMPGTAQMAKMYRAEKRGETTYGQWVGTYTPPEKRRRPARRRRGGLGGGLRGGL